MVAVRMIHAFVPVMRERGWGRVINISSGGGAAPTPEAAAYIRWQFSNLSEKTPHGELLFSLVGALAQYERALTRERVMAASQRRGRQGGRPP